MATLSHSRYRIVNGVRLVEIRVHTALQLFDARDPAPFRARDLDDDFTEYVVTSADEIGGEPMKISIQVEEAEGQINAETIKESLRSYIEYQIELRRIQLMKLFRTVRLFLGIGFVCVVICLFLAQMVEHTEYYQTQPGKILREGLIIFGWVALWKPFELVLFDWYPVFDRIRLYRRMLKAPTEVQFGKATVPH